MHIVALIPPDSVSFLDQILGKFVTEMLHLAEGITVCDSSHDPPQERQLSAFLLRVLCDLPAKKKVSQLSAVQSAHSVNIIVCENRRCWCILWLLPMFFLWWMECCCQSRHFPLTSTFSTSECFWLARSECYAKYGCSWNGWFPSTSTATQGWFQLCKGPPIGLDACGFSQFIKGSGHQDLV